MPGLWVGGGMSVHLMATETRAVCGATSVHKRTREMGDTTCPRCRSVIRANVYPKMRGRRWVDFVKAGPIHRHDCGVGGQWTEAVHLATCNCSPAVGRRAIARFLEKLDDAGYVIAHFDEDPAVVSVSCEDIELLVAEAVK